MINTKSKNELNEAPSSTQLQYNIIKCLARKKIIGF